MRGAVRRESGASHVAQFTPALLASSALSQRRSSSLAPVAVRGRHRFAQARGLHVAARVVEGSSVNKVGVDPVTSKRGT